MPIGGIVRIILTALIARNFCFSFSFWLRLCKVGGLIGLIASAKRSRMARIYGLQIHWKTTSDELNFSSIIRIPLLIRVQERSLIF